MKAEELMIGDWAKFTIYPRNQGDRVIYSKIIKLEADIEFRAEPIPLTTEILELNGFVLESNSTYMKEGVRLVWWSNTDFYINYYYCGEKEFPVRVSKLVKYVHELQHALRLCGFNELADNFKVE